MNQTIPTLLDQHNTWAGTLPTQEIIAAVNALTISIRNLIWIDIHQQGKASPHHTEWHNRLCNQCARLKEQIHV